MAISVIFVINDQQLLTNKGLRRGSLFIIFTLRVLSRLWLYQIKGFASTIYVNARRQLCITSGSSKFAKVRNKRSRFQNRDALIFRVRRILVTYPRLNGRPLGNPLDPLFQMRERLHILVREAGKLISLHPRPGTNIGNRVFPFALSGEIFAWLACVFP